MVGWKSKKQEKVKATTIKIKTAVIWCALVLSLSDSMCLITLAPYLSEGLAAALTVVVLDAGVNLYVRVHVALLGEALSADLQK